MSAIVVCPLESGRSAIHHTSYPTKRQDGEVPTNPTSRYPIGKLPVVNQ